MSRARMCFMMLITVIFWEILCYTYFNVSRKNAFDSISFLIEDANETNEPERIRIQYVNRIIHWESLISGGEDFIIATNKTNYLLLVRKLVIFSVREINLRNSEDNCVPWWANPLNVLETDESKISLNETEHRLVFEIQPGQVTIESIINVRSRKSLRNSSNAYPSDQLTFISAKILSSSNGECKAKSNLPCLCPEQKSQAEALTETARAKWKTSDPELFSWLPNVSASVADYITFGDMKPYFLSPTLEDDDFCGPIVKMIVFVSSAPSHFSYRQAIRETYGNPNNVKPNTRLLFLFGKVTNASLQDEINEEFSKHKDIVQANFMDSYHNLSLSHLSMYNWVDQFCKQKNASIPGWMLKADDDFILNIPLALQIANANPEAELIGCHYCGTRAIRDVAYMTKYYVPRYMYPPDYYIGYLSGVAYLVRSDVLKYIVKASKTVPLVHMDDVYVMGILTREVGILPRSSVLITYGRKPDNCTIKQTMNSYASSHDDMRLQWQSMESPIPEACEFDKNLLKISPLRDQDKRFCLFHDD